MEEPLNSKRHLEIYLASGADVVGKVAKLGSLRAPPRPPAQQQRGRSSHSEVGGSRGAGCSSSPTGGSVGCWLVLRRRTRAQLRRELQQQRLCSGLAKEQLLLVTNSSPCRPRCARRMRVEQRLLKHRSLLKRRHWLWAPAQCRPCLQLRRYRWQQYRWLLRNRQHSMGLC